MPERHARPHFPATRFTDVREYSEVDSTNRLAADLVRAGASEGLVVVADHQTAGRGRRGRSWEAPPGSSLLVSVVLRLPAVARVPLVTVACALAAADACADVAGFAPGLKWPNDLVVGERKLGGVLAEVAVAGEAVVVGVGINVCWPGPMPAHLEAITAEVVAGRPVDRRALRNAYLVRLEGRCRELADAEGSSAMMDDYRRRCVTLGQAVRVELPGGRACVGTATALADDGSLVVTSVSGIRHIMAGDVVHLLPT